MTYLQEHWYLKDLQYEYLDDGFKLTAYTDVPCHLYCRMTTTPPRKHALPSYRRGLYMQGDIRFCFVVYEDNEQDEPGDTTTHTWLKSAWPICETRWFYFVGTINATPVVSESPIFKFHFPAPPPEPPPPMQKLLYPSVNNRTLWYSAAGWAATRNYALGYTHPWWELPNAKLFAGDQKVATFFIWRGLLDFDTSPLPDTAILLSAKLFIYVTAIYQSDATRPKLYVTPGLQHLPPVSSDYGAQKDYTTPLGEADITSFSLNAYNEIPLTQAGLEYLDLSGLTKLCLRGQNDVENYASVPWYDNWVQYHSQQKGAGYLPYLKFTYYPA